jgi:hypothetical protein
VLLGVANGSASGADQRAFFFDGERYLGTDTKDPSAHVAFVGQTGDTVTLRYTLYRASDPLCCPGAGARDVRFRWNGSKLEPLDLIPPTEPGAAASRR